MPRNKWLLVGFISLTPLFTIDISRAKELNNAGMRKYDEKKYTEAAELFKKAIALYPDYVNANYNLACVYALAPKCEFTAGERNIFQYLDKAIKLEPARKEKAKKDPDFKAYKNSWNFIKLIDAVKTDKEIFKAIVKMNIHSILKSEMRTTGFEKYTFHGDGRFQYFEETTIEEPIDNGEFVTIRKNHSKAGQFQVRSGKLIFLIKSDVITKEVHGQEEMLKDDYYEKPLQEEYNPDKLFILQDIDETCGV